MSCGEPCDSCTHRASHHLCDECCEQDLKALKAERDTWKKMRDAEAKAVVACQDEIERLNKTLLQEQNLRVMAEKFHDVAIKERDLERHRVNELRRELPQYDCRRTGGPVSDISGRHCPLDKPCLTCRYEDLEMKRADCCIEMEQALEQVAPDWIGDNIEDIQVCLKAGIAEFAIRLLRAKKALEKSKEIKNELVDRVVHSNN